MSYDSRSVQKSIDEIVRRRAMELGITPEQAFELYRSPFLFMIENWKKAVKNEVDTFESTYIKGLGVFYPKTTFIKKLKEKHEASNNDK